MTKQQITAIVYDKRDRILSVGRNSYIRTHPLQAKAAKAVGEPSKIYLHAEIAAIIKLRDWNKAHRIVVTRFNKYGLPMLAKPCRCCQHVIRQTGIKEIEHT
jgi:deoxycytidylate deaminase